MFAVIDIESTGGGHKIEKIIDIAIYVHNGNRITHSFSSLVNPGIPIPSFVKKLTGITDKMVSTAPTFNEIAATIQHITQGSIVVAHNAQYDYGILRQEFKRVGFPFKRKKLCTIKAAQKLYPNRDSYGLDSLCEEFDINVLDRHRASGDAQATVALFEELMKSDEKEIINKLINNPHVLENFAPNVSFKEVYKVPEGTGLFYFHDKDGKILMLSRSNALRDRTLQYLIKEPINKDKIKLFNEVHSVSYKLTGSELLSILLENHDINTLSPEYNKKLRINTQQPSGIIVRKSNNGYLQLKVGKIYPKYDNIGIFDKTNQAHTKLRQLVKQHKLCNKLVESDVKRCYCKGDCVMDKMASEEYNAKINALIKKQDRAIPSDFLIVGEGRFINEISVIGVKNKAFVGYCFLDRNTSLKNPKEIFNQIEELPNNFLSNLALQSYFPKLKKHQIIRF